MRSFKRYLTEDIVDVLNQSTRLIKSGKIDQLPNTHIHTLAALRIYVYLNNDDNKAKVGRDRLVGDNISDADAIRALSVYLSNGNGKLQRLTANEVRSVERLIQDGHKDGYADLLAAIEHVKNRLHK